MPKRKKIPQTPLSEDAKMSHTKKFPQTQLTPQYLQPQKHDFPVSQLQTLTLFVCDLLFFH